jgi:FMN phosphatase YigB (HAD superfamily)
MPFVTRDETGRVTALHREQTPDAQEYLPAGHQEILEFTGQGGISDERPDMRQSDLEMIRVYEDLIDILISKRIVVLTDFPTAAQEKLVRRKRLRSSLSSLTEVLALEDEGELP